LTLIFGFETPPPVGKGFYVDDVVIDRVGGPDIIVPAIKSVRRVGPNLIIQGTGSPDGTYTVLGSPDVAAPLANWMTNMTGVLTGTGTFSNAIPFNPLAPHEFFMLHEP
jgi:hypothetical protein